LPIIIGQDIGRYHILEQLGRGGMAVVYKAYDPKSDRYVALKIIRKQAFPEEVHERLLQRFMIEAKTLVRLRHPNIVNIYDYGEFEGSPFLIIEYIDGGTLKSILGKPIPYQYAAKILAPIADGLAYAHEFGVLHRDVKPSNILIRKDGTPVLTDFGVAKLFDDNNSDATLTGTGLGVVTPEYMAPEQGFSKNIDGRADEYALGIVFYEMITGIKPFSADTPMAVLLKQQTDPLPSPKLYVPDLPDPVERILFKVLSKKPENRCRKISDFADILHKLSEDTSLPQKTINANKSNSIARNDAEAVDLLSENFTPDAKIPHNNKSKHRFIVAASVLLLLLAVALFFFRPWQSLIPLNVSPTRDKTEIAFAKEVQKKDLAMRQTVDYLDKEKIFTAAAAFLNTRAAQISFEQTSQKKIKESSGQTQAVIEAMKITAADLLTQTMDAKLWTATPTNSPSPTNVSPSRDKTEIAFAKEVQQTDLAMHQTVDYFDKEKIFTAIATFLNMRAAQFSFEQTSQKKIKESSDQTQAIIEVKKITATDLMTQTMDAKLWTATPTNSLSPTITHTPSPTITSKPPLEIGSQKVREKDGMVMVYVPEGDFIMGAECDSDNCDYDPRHTIYLDAFWIDRTEVTNEKYAKCVAEGFCSEPAARYSITREDYYNNSYGSFDDYPVIMVDWNQAKSYCLWAGGDLPTEAQWEKAARGTDGKTFPWGDSIYKNSINYTGIVKDTTRVASFSQDFSPYGSFDMAGNVAEWVNDWYDENYYDISPYKNPTGPIDGEARVIRGGNWFYNQSEKLIFMYTYYRDSASPDRKFVTHGFRCAFSQ